MLGRTKVAARRNNWVPIVMLLAIVSLVLGAVFTGRANTYDPDVVKCGDEVMSQGDTCLGIGGDSNEGTGSYDEVKADQDSNHEVDQIVGPVGLGAGGVLLILGIALIVARRRALARLTS
jgi:hypothetical protein